MEVPYPPVFRDWRDREHGGRVTTSSAPGGVGVQVMLPDHTCDRFGVPRGWAAPVEITETDAALLAVSLLERAGQCHPLFLKLAKRTLKWLTKHEIDLP